MKVKNLMLFIYDFPHKKTQDFIYRLVTEGYIIKYVIAAPFKKLKINPPAIRLSPRHAGLVHPKLICKRFQIKYLKADHNSYNTQKFISENPVDIYIIAGARILSSKTINSCKNKILNIHPGLLPEIRGLDTFLWSISYNKPLGITAHFITPKIDSGFLVYRERLPISKDDTPIDLNLRLLEYQSDVLSKSLKILSKTVIKNLKDLSLINSPYNTKMGQSEEKEALKKFSSWLKTYAKK